MKPKFVSLIAVLFCTAVFLIVGIFGYSRYKARQTADAQYRLQLQSGSQQAVLGTHMPEELPARLSGNGDQIPASTPQPAQ
jgi:hypothetical protein